MPTQQSIASQMMQALAVTEPNLDSSIGTPVRSILDAVSEPIAEAYADQFLLNYQYDIDNMTGSNLDSFVAVFGFARFAAKRATGIVTFSRNTVTLTDIFITAGTQVATNTSPSIVFNTVIPATMPTGTNSIDVPIQAQVGGTSGNVAAASIVSAAGGFTGISTIFNAAATSGGTDPESDDELRARFKATVFRSLAGTEQMYLGVALNDPDVTHANVIGAQKTYTEQIQISGGTGASSVQNLSYLYASTVTFGKDIFGGNIFSTPSQYTFALSGSTPTITVVDTVNIPDGIYELSYEYLPTSSRNNPSSGITNCVDIYVNGSRPIEVTQVGQFNTTYPFNTTSGDPLNRLNFVRADGTNPVSGNYFVPFAFSPVINPALPAGTITVGATTYVYGTDFWLVNDITNTGLGPQSRSGIEWVSSHHPTSPSTLNLDYDINQIPQSVQKAIQNWRILDTDVMVHQAHELYLNFFFGVILSPGYDPQTVNANIYTNLSNYISSQSFDNIIQISQCLSLVQQTNGVVAARFLTSTDNVLLVGNTNTSGPSNGDYNGTGTTTRSGFSAPAVYYAIQSTPSSSSYTYTTYATGSGSPLRAIDIYLNDNTVAIPNQVFISPMGQNLFGAV